MRSSDREVLLERLGGRGISVFGRVLGHAEPNRDSSYIRKNWIEDHSPMLVSMRTEMERQKPFEGTKFGVCLPETWESYMFLSTLASGGAEIWFHPMFRKPEVEIELSKSSIEIVRFRDLEKYAKSTDFLYDSTALLGRIVVEEDAPVKGIVEQTASGTRIYSEYDEKGLLKQPVLNLDAAYVKRTGENMLATGLGLLEALLRLHLFLPSKRVLILGFGSVGKGCAMFLRKLGCAVCVYDIDPQKTLEARNSGYETGKLEPLISQADIVVNATGSLTPVLGDEHLSMMKCGAILANMGGEGWDREFFVEKHQEEMGGSLLKIFLSDSTYVYEMARGLPVNFVFASGTDAETMDIVFSLSILAFEYLVENYGSLPKRLQPIPEEVQRRHLELVSKVSARKDLAKMAEAC